MLPNKRTIKKLSGKLSLHMWGKLSLFLHSLTKTLCMSVCLNIDYAEQDIHVEEVQSKDRAHYLPSVQFYSM